MRKEKRVARAGRHACNLLRKESTPTDSSTTPPTAKTNTHEMRERYRKRQKCKERKRQKTRKDKLQRQAQVDPAQ